MSVNFSYFRTKFLPRLFPVILASGFDILLGRIEVQVPWVVNGDDYQVVCELGN